MVAPRKSRTVRPPRFVMRFPTDSCESSRTGSIDTESNRQLTGMAGLFCHFRTVSPVVFRAGSGSRILRGWDCDFPADLRVIPDVVWLGDFRKHGALAIGGVVCGRDIL